MDGGQLIVPPDEASSSQTEDEDEDSTRQGRITFP